MHTRTKHLLLPSAALSLLAGCLLEVTPAPDTEPLSPPPPGAVLDLKGQLVDAAGAAAPFVPVRLGGQGGPIIATDQAGFFLFPAVRLGTHSVYAYDELDGSVGAATIELSPGSDDDGVIELHSCNDAVNGGDRPDIEFMELIEICFGNTIDLPPDTKDASLGALELSSGLGDTSASRTSLHLAAASGEARETFFAMDDGLARGGVRELTMVNHRLQGAEPGSDPFGEPTFGITLQDTNGHQSYVVRDGVLRLEVAEGEGPTRSYVLTATSLVLDYGTSRDSFDPAYTLTVPSLRLEGTLEVDLPPPAPAGDISLALPSPFFFADYKPGQNLMRVTVLGEGPEVVALAIDTEPLPLPGTVTVELPVGDAPDLEGSVLRMPSADGLSTWDFQLVSYTLTTQMSELPECDEQLLMTLENLVFRFVGWDYDENSDRVDSFGEQRLTIDRIDVDTAIVGKVDGTCPSDGTPPPLPPPGA